MAEEQQSKNLADRPHPHATDAVGARLKVRPIIEALRQEREDRAERNRGRVRIDPRK